MRAWRVHSLGDPAEVMSLDEVDQPTPGDGQVLVEVRAAGLNFPDVLMAMGQYQERPPLPFTPGVELCGEVVGHRSAGARLTGRRAGRIRRVRADGRRRGVPGARRDVRRAGRLAVPHLPDRLRRAAPSRRPAGGGVAAGARRRGRRRLGGHPAGQGRRRHGHRHRRRGAQDRGLPPAGRRPRHRLHHRGLRAAGQGDHRGPRRGRRLRPGRRRGVRQVPDGASPSRAGWSSSASPAAPSRRRRSTTRWSRTTASSGCTGGCTASTTRRCSGRCTRSCARSSPTARSPRWSGRRCRWTELPQAMAAIADRSTVGKVVLKP